MGIYRDDRKGWIGAMKRAIGFGVALIVGFGAPAFAQNPATGNNQIGWTQTGPDLATVQGYTYKHYDDASATGTAFLSVTCAAQTPPVAGTFDCSAAFPAFAPGTHTMAISASNLAGESAKSSPLSFVFVVTPAVPTALGIK